MLNVHAQTLLAHPVFDAGDIVVADERERCVTETHRIANAMAGIAPQGSQCGTVDALPFEGFEAPVANTPSVSEVQPGSTVPMKFTLPGIKADLISVLAAGYPVSAPTSCTSPDLTLTTGDPATAGDNADSCHSDNYNYAWKTDRAWSGCRELFMKLTDGSYHRALFEFGP